MRPPPAPPPRPPIRRALEWVRARFFASVPNAVSTLVMAWLLVMAVPAAWRYFVTDSVLDRAGGAQVDIRTCVQAGGFCWAFLQDRWRGILFGTFPYEEQWRAGVASAIFVALIALTAWMAASPARRRPWALLAAWGAGLAMVAALMWGGVAGLAPVPARLWSGLPLTLMLASVGTALAFLAGIGLALGRREGPPLIRWLCVGYIEFFRGVPLVSLLFVGSILLPMLLPPGAEVDKLLRAQGVFAMFFAAYMAEAVRGGLQSVPRGQAAAATALGMSWWQCQVRIVLPQALRLVIPSLVNIFIAAFKDTSLVVVIAMLDLLGTANSARADARWWGIFIEPYAFIAVIYFLFCAAMAAYSRLLERRLASGAA